MSDKPKLSYKARKRWALFALVVGMPAYVVLAVTVMNALASTEWPTFVELFVYIALGIGWIFPLKRIFLGIGQADPDAE